MTDPRHAPYYRELGAAIALYALVLVASILVLNRLDEADGTVRALIALTPMVPGALVCWSVLRHMRRIDELERRVQFEAIGFAFAATALVTFGYGFLEGVGFPRLSLFVVWPLMGGFWIIGGQLAARRYR